jgi:hypothetical chaperone protein
MSSTLAIDFGTTNTVLAATENGATNIISIAHKNEALQTIRTALAFQRSGCGEPVTEIGPWAIQAFLDDPENTRFLQSFKSFAATASFSETQVFTRRMGFPHLLESFLAHTLARANMKAMPKRLVMGRPVTFAGQNPDDTLAMQRYEAALKSLGAEEVIYVQEPVAAAYFYAQRLTSPATVLVGDFGGGTSDFSLLRFSGKGQVEALGQTGIGIAGDTFDYRILDHVVTPQLGKGGTFKSWDKSLPIPAHYFASFSRWNELCLMNKPSTLAELRDFARTSPEAKQLQALIALIEGGESYALYQALSRAKAELSVQEHVTFNFECHGIAITHPISRSNFERWITKDVERMLDCADSLLLKTNFASHTVDRVFLTGGTSFVPAVRNAFAQRFGEQKIETGDELISIAKGLSLIGASDDAEKWAMKIT